MLQTATRHATGYTPKTSRVKTETPEERNMRLYGCPLDHTPNAETGAAIEEGDAILRGEIPGKWFDSFDEFWDDLVK